MLSTACRVSFWINLDHAADLLGRLAGALCQLAHLISHDRETRALFAGARAASIAAFRPAGWSDRQSS